MTGHDVFDTDVRELFTARCEDFDFACRLWGSLANVEWQKAGAGFGYTFRQAGSVIAEMRGETGPHRYMPYYCSVPDGVPDPDVVEAFATRGYRPETNVSKWILP